MNIATQNDLMSGEMRVRYLILGAAVPEAPKEKRKDPRGPFLFFEDNQLNFLPFVTTRLVTVFVLFVFVVAFVFLIFIVPMIVVVPMPTVFLVFAGRRWVRQYVATDNVGVRHGHADIRQGTTG